MTIDEFKTEVQKNSVEKTINEILFAAQPICFAKNKELIWELKNRISKYLQIPIRNIEIVGSAKIGISLSEERFGKNYNNNSDIDIVIVSTELFNQAWNELLLIDYQYYKLREVERQNLDDSYNTIHKGFISPDRLPSCEFKEYWWKLFNELSNKPKFEYRKIRGRLFSSWQFVEKYYSIQIIKMKNSK